ncbi:MAG: GAF domain-containing sensor histidine kinase [Candidatus Eremiobacteraeota bacterium]|nr:GAF domain-containing sensor histidine kinase [Candidatus Eremiobacteraeota bacterium]MCW5871356.1 GAF domain-containing sensor histidine kinase [Candidatus Eremiobacteraeota bacterium]
MSSTVDPILRLLEVTRSITGVLDLDQLLQHILNQAVEMMKAERGYLLLLDPDTTLPMDRRLQVRAAYRLGAEELLEDDFSLSRTAILKVLEGGSTHHSQDALREPNPSHSVEMFGLRSILCEPLIVQDRMQGVLYLDSRIINRFSPWCREVLPSLASQAAICIENAKLLSQREEAMRAQYHDQMRALEMEAWKNAMAAFVSIASHDLKGPLTVLQNGLALLNRRPQNPPPPDLLKDMEVSLLRARRLVEDYLDAAALQQGQSLSLRWEQLDLHQLVQRELTQVEANLHVKKRDLYRFINAVPPDTLVHSDEMRLRQVLANLLENAVKYGRGTISVRLHPGQGEGERAWVEVSDEGPGIPLESQDRLFDRYFRAEPNSSVRGTGLGLWIVRQVVEALGGEVAVSSQPNQGARFSFSVETILPPAPPEPPAVPALPGRAHPASA